MNNINFEKKTIIKLIIIHEDGAGLEATGAGLRKNFEISKTRMTFDQKNLYTKNIALSYAYSILQELSNYLYYLLRKVCFVFEIFDG